MSKSTDIAEVIVESIINDPNNPLKMNESELSEFAEKISEICVRHAFKKNREKFRKELRAYLAELALKFDRR